MKFIIATILLLQTDVSALGIRSQVRTRQETDVKELSQTVVDAFQITSPRSISEPDKDLPKESGTQLTWEGTGHAFKDGWYYNTTRKEDKQDYLYMWQHACAWTKWIPSNQFMHANMIYDPTTMTLERFGFIGTAQKCYWGSIGVMWKRPLPVSQILPNKTLQAAPVPPPAPTDNTSIPPPAPQGIANGPDMIPNAFWTLKGDPNHPKGGEWGKAPGHEKVIFVSPDNKLMSIFVGPFDERDGKPMGADKDFATEDGSAEKFLPVHIEGNVFAFKSTNPVFNSYISCGNDHLMNSTPADNGIGDSNEFEVYLTNEAGSGAPPNGDKYIALKSKKSGLWVYVEEADNLIRCDGIEAGPMSKWHGWQ